MKLHSMVTISLALLGASMTAIHWKGTEVYDEVTADCHDLLLENVGNADLRNISTCKVTVEELLAMEAEVKKIREQNKGAWN